MVNFEAIGSNDSFAVKNFRLSVRVVMCILERVEVDWATNSRASMCILAWVWSNRGGNFGCSSTCSESLTIRP